MTVIVPEKVTCPGCGQQVQVYVLESEHLVIDAPEVLKPPR